MDAQFHEELTAELAALNTAVIKALSGMAAVVEASGVMSRKEYLEKLLHSGEDGMADTNYLGIPAERRDTVIELARAKYTDFIDAAYRGKS